MNGTESSLEMLAKSLERDGKAGSPLHQIIRGRGMPDESKEGVDISPTFLIPRKPKASRRRNTPKPKNRKTLATRVVPPQSSNNNNSDPGSCSPKIPTATRTSSLASPQTNDFTSPIIQRAVLRSSLPASLGKKMIVQQPMNTARTSTEADDSPTLAGTSVLSNGFTLDTESIWGGIDVWPAKGNNVKSANIARHKASINMDRKIDTYCSTDPKPKLLQQLDWFVEHELGILGLNESGPCEAKLQVYREAFHMFTQHFRTYRPFLLQVKHEYDGLIEVLTTKLNEIPKLKQGLAEGKKELQLKLDQLRVSSDMQVSHLRRSLLEQRKKYMESSQRANEALAEVEKRSAHLEEREKAMDQLKNANTTLTQSLMRLEEEMEKMKSMETEKQSRILNLKLSCDKANQEVEKLQHSLEELEELHSKMVHPNELERKEAQIQALKKELGTTRHEWRKNTEKYHTLKSTVDTVWVDTDLERADSFFNENEEASLESRDEQDKFFSQNSLEDPLTPSDSRQSSFSMQEGAQIKEETPIRPPLDKPFLKSTGHQGTIKLMLDTMDKDNCEEQGGVLHLSQVTQKQIEEIESKGSTPRIEEDVEADQQPRTVSKDAGQEKKSPKARRSFGNPMFLRNMRQSFSSSVSSRRESQRLWMTSPRGDQGILDCSNRSSCSIQSSVVDNLLNEVAKLKSQLAEDKNSIQIGDELGKKDLEEFKPPDHNFMGRGLGSDVPIYLRATGAFRNWRLQKHEATRMVRDIWKAKCGSKRMRSRCMGNIDDSATMDTSGLSQPSERSRSTLEHSKENKWANVSMAEFLLHFLTERFNSNQTLISEWAYNIEDALERYECQSVDCRLFRLVLNGELTEEVQKSQFDMLNEFEEELQKEDRLQNSGVLTGMLQVSQFNAVLKRWAPLKRHNALKKLDKALQFDINHASEVEYHSLLFDSRGSFSRGKFTETLRDQDLKDIVAYTTHVIDCIEQANHLHRESEHGQLAPQKAQSDEALSIKEFRDALQLADNTLSRPQASARLAQGCGTGVEEMLEMEAKEEKFPVCQFISNLKAGGVLKKGMENTSSVSSS